MAKGPEAFRTISEAAEELNTPQHVLRFWETKFSFIRPMKRAGGRRFYRPQDVAVLRGVKTLLHVHGYSIKGAQQLHKDEGLRCQYHGWRFDAAGAKVGVALCANSGVAPNALQLSTVSEPSRMSTRRKDARDEARDERLG